MGGTTQVTLKKGTADPSLFALFAELPRESIVEVEGTVRRSERANRGLELYPSKVAVVSRAEVPLPLGVVDKVGADLDTRLNHRVIDLRKPAVRAVFELRTALLAGFRTAFLRRGFLEVETPKLLRQGAEGGATLFGVDYFDRRAYLAQSPQLYKQMLIGAGFERVFEIAPAFRAEPSDTVRHITEFTSLDAEIGYVDSAEEIREILEQVVAEAVGSTRTTLAERSNPLASSIPELTLPFPRFAFRTCEEWLGRPGAERDLGAEDERAIGERVAKDLAAPFYFVTDFPTAVKAQTFYAQRRDDDPRHDGVLRPRLPGPGDRQRRTARAPARPPHGQPPERRTRPFQVRRLPRGVPLRDAPARGLGSGHRPPRAGARRAPQYTGGPLVPARPLSP